MDTWVWDSIDISIDVMDMGYFEKEGHDENKYPFTVIIEFFCNDQMNVSSLLFLHMVTSLTIVLYLDFPSRWGFLYDT